MIYALLAALSVVFFSTQAMEEQTTNLSDRQKKVVILSAVHDVLLRPSTDNLPLPSCLTAKSLEKELLATIALNTSYSQTEAAQHHGTLPLPIKSWLLDLESGETIKQLARTNINWFTQPILYKVAGAAFSPKKATSYLTPIQDVVTLLALCKKDGNEVAIATNWNSESFAEVKKQHASVVNLFEEQFISGQLKQLTMEPAFFEKIQEKMGSDKKYYYLDCAEGKESLDAAAHAGITPLSIPDGSDTEKTAALKTLLVNYKLLSTEEPL